VLYSRGTDNAENSFTADHTKTSHVIAKHGWGVTSLSIRKLHGHKENIAAVLCDVTAYAEVCLPSRCQKMGCITRLSYCCVRVLLGNGCFCASTVLAWSKYATILSSNLCLGLPNGLLPSGFPTKILYAFLFSRMRATCPKIKHNYWKTCNI
jgi:hypothetical protein